MQPQLNFGIGTLKLSFTDKELKERHLASRRERKDSAETVLSNPLLGDSFKPRPSLDRTPRRHIDFRTEGSILTFTLSKI